MNGWLATRNNRSEARADIPAWTLPDLAAEIIRRCQEGLRLAALFGVPTDGRLTVYAILADDSAARLWIAGAVAAPGVAYPAITREVPAAHVFERELWEEHGLQPEGHPWHKPVRYPHARADREQTMAGYP